MSSKYEFLSPDFTSTEIFKYKDLIMKKSDLSDKSFNVVLNMLLEKIDIRPKQEYQAR